MPAGTTIGAVIKHRSIDVDFWKVLGYTISKIRLILKEANCNEYKLTLQQMSKFFFNVISFLVDIVNFKWQRIIVTSFYSGLHL